MMHISYLIQIKGIDMSRSNRHDRDDRREYHNSRERTEEKRSFNSNNRDYNRREDHNQRWRKGTGYNNNERHKYEQKHSKQVIQVVETLVDKPAEFTISDEQCPLIGKLVVDFRVATHIPNRLDGTRLGQLKNMITPIERLWTSHIKQYLNISEFVEIYRKYKSLDSHPIEYGKSIIQYNEGASDMVYDNSKEQSPIFSRAYFKLWEILQMGVLSQHKNKALTIGCVAQGPGGFIHALLDYRERQHKGEDCPPKDNYHAITLRIDENTRNAKDWSDSRAKRLFESMRKFGYKIHLSYGQTKTGDLLKVENIEYFKGEMKKKCELVTGDGGIECIGDKQFEYQQIFNVKLFLGEIITALHIQQNEGTFILKIYDCGFELTRQVILLLALYYSKVRIVKPITSRPGNSERYLLCQGFRGISEEDLTQLKKLLVAWTSIEPKISYFQNQEFAENLFDFQHLPNYQAVYDNIKTSNDIFVKEQEQKLEEGLKLAQKYENAKNIEEELHKTRFQQQTSFAFAWCKKYGLPTIPVEMVKPTI